MFESEMISTSYSVKDQTITLIDDRYNDEILILNRKQALWLAETILKNFRVKLS